MTSGPQLLEHLSKSVPHTVYDAKWVPSSAKVVVLGAQPRGTGSLKVFELDGPELKQLATADYPHGLKCGSFGASSLADRHLATGDLGGQLQVIDLERPSQPVLQVQAHKGVVNGLDAFGGQVHGFGAPEVVTCGSDGAVRVWDARQPEAPVAAFVPAEPSNGAAMHDCWCVALGNSYNDQERCVLAGYDNGDIKMFDLRTNTVRWEGNVGNGVCAVQFDRRDIAMNKFMAACLESQLVLCDARTQHPTKGFALRTEKLPPAATLWTVQHMPQNRDVFAVGAGDGSLTLCKVVKDSKTGESMGVVGTMETLATKTLSSQPISSFDWHPDKAGLFVTTAFDQCVRVGILTKAHSL
ncbi:hypothetical protein N2152v2_002274 [Parachlorella kessleri]